MLKNLRALVALWPLQAAIEGKESGNPLGDGGAILPLQGGERGIFHFNFHPSPRGVNSIGAEVPGNTLILGVIGEGKTTMQTVISAFASRFDVSFFGLDKEGSMRGFFESLGGTYVEVVPGVPTGLNPCQQGDNAGTTEDLYELVGACCTIGNAPLTAEEMSDVKNGVDAMMRLPYSARRFAMIYQNLPNRDGECVKKRFAQWCHTSTGSGRFADVLDNGKNAFDWTALRSLCFDVSEYLKPGNPVTGPLLAYLLRIKKLMASRRAGWLCTIMEEFWVPLQYEITARAILDIYKTGRRRKEWLVAVSQSPEDVIASPLLATIVQQTATFMLLPNPGAEYKNDEGGGYYRLGLSEQEFNVMRNLGKGSRRFLLRQGGHAGVCRLDLAGLEDYIGVLAMARDDFLDLEAAELAAGGRYLRSLGTRIFTATRGAQS